MFEKVKIGLALGAGGARGLAHLGVLKALEKAGVGIACLAGSSIGALVGASYAVSGNTAELEARLNEFLTTDRFRESGLSLVLDAFQERPDSWTQRVDTWLKKTYLQARMVARPALLDSNLYREMIEFFLPKINIEDLAVPFQALGTDLRSGRAVVFKSGPLRAAVYGSAAIPGLVLPLALNDWLVVDGGVLNMVPVLPARRMGADVVVAVDVEKKVDRTENFGSAFDHLFRVEDVQSYFLKEWQLSYADLVLRPGVGHIHWSDFGRAQEMIRLGLDESTLHLETIMALARRRRWPRLPWTGCRTLPAGDWLET